MGKPVAANQQVRGRSPQFQVRPPAPTSTTETANANTTGNSSAPPFGSVDFPDADVELSSQASGHGKGKGKAKGHNRDNGGFKNHGQMVKAAREAGYSGRDLAAVAKGETPVDSQGLTAIKNGDLSINEYQKAREGVANGDFTLEEFLSGLERVTAGEVTFADLVKELTEPAPVEEVGEVAATTANPTATAPATAAAPEGEVETKPAPAATEPAPLTLSTSGNSAPAEGLAFLRMRGSRFGR